MPDQSRQLAAIMLDLRNFSVGGTALSSICEGGSACRSYSVVRFTEIVVILQSG